MKLSEQWLRSWLPEAKKLSTQDMVEALTDLGIEVDDCHPDELDPTDCVYTLKTPANRGDCMSVLGVVRELSARFAMPHVVPFDIKKTKVATQKAAQSLVVSVDKGVQKDCPLYQAAVVTGIQPDAVTPEWMLQRLRKSGIRSHFPVVDILNYVMLEWGQPMHAFDQNTLSGDLCVRYAKHKETLVTLDDTTLTLAPNTLVIADDKGPQAIAGVIGGLKTGVTADTTAVVLESAYFNPVSIRLAARAYGTRTDAAQRFERGVDPQGVSIALHRALDLIKTITGGTLTQEIIVQSETDYPKETMVHFPLSACQEILGIDLPVKTQEDLLTCLGFSVQHSSKTHFNVKVPSYRADVSLVVDLVEELARLQGLDKIVSSLPSVTLNPPELNRVMQRERAIQQWLSTRGYQEAITYSFIDPILSTAFSGAESALKLLNPISSEMATMRESLLPGLLSTLKHHQRNNGTSAAFFELGRCFSGNSAEQATQKKALGVVATGAILSASWGLPTPALSHDFFSLKSEAEKLCSAIMGKTAGLQFSPCSHPAFHPGESADLRVSGKIIGVVGALHPRLQSMMGLEGAIYAIELFDIDTLPAPTRVQFTAFSRYPTVTRDLALLVPLAITAESVETVIASVVNAAWIFQQTIFDVYQGKGISLANHKSLGIKLTFQHPDRTLLDEEVGATIESILKKLNEVHGIQLRQ
jgi:phenylalanyl-tRNA synthetase beta chain